MRKSSGATMRSRAMSPSRYRSRSSTSCPVGSTAAAASSTTTMTSRAAWCPQRTVRARSGSAGTGTGRSFVLMEAAGSWEDRRALGTWGHGNGEAWARPEARASALAAALVPRRPVLVREQRRVELRRLLGDLALQALRHGIQARADTVVEQTLHPRVVAVERVDDVLHQAVAHDVFRVEVHELDVGDVAENRLDAHEARLVGHAQVDLGEVAGDDRARVEPEAGEEPFYLAHGGVLRLVEDHERVGERAAAHERERRDLDHAHLEEAAHLVVRHEVGERVVHGAQVGIHLPAPHV